MKRLAAPVLVMLPAWALALDARDVRLVVDRVWTDSVGYGHVLVTVENNATKETLQVAEIECLALDGAGSRVAVEEARVDPIAPGDSKTKELFINLAGAAMASAKCSGSFR